jgi:signal recognition particle subunit SRP54
MGPLSKVLGMLPGVGSQLKDAQIDDREMDRVEAIILSMTKQERRQPELIKGGRRLRIAKGSGTSVQQVNQLVKNFQQMRKMMKQMSKGGMKGLEGMMGGAGLPGAGGAGQAGQGAPVGVRGGSRAARRRKR